MTEPSASDIKQWESLLKIHRNKLQQLQADLAKPGTNKAVLTKEIEKREIAIADLKAKITPSVPVPVVAAPEPPALPPREIEVKFQTQEGSALLTWNTKFFGREVSSFLPPYDDVLLPLVVRALDIVQYPGYPEPSNEYEQRLFAFSEAEQELLEALDLWRENRVVKHIYKAVGAQMFQAFDPNGPWVLKTLRNLAIEQAGRANHFVFHFPRDAVSLAALPWEMLWDPQNNRPALLSGSSLDSLQRYVDIDQGVPQPRTVGERLHLLALSPAFGIPIDLREEERQARLKTWNKLGPAAEIHEIEPPLTMRKLNDFLDQIDPLKPDIIHYYGHGTYQYDEFNQGTGFLLFDDGKGGKEMVSTERLAMALNGAKLAVIFACQSAMINSGSGLLTGLAPTLSLATDSVVAMQLTMRTEASTLFSEDFYDQLLIKGHSLQAAVAHARRRLFMIEPDGTSWFVPTLYTRTTDQGPIYLVNKNEG